jgi:hypothetical protein
MKDMSEVFFSEQISPNLPKDVPQTLFEKLKKEFIKRSNKKDWSRFIWLTKTLDKVFSDEYNPTIKSKHLTDNQIQALIKAGIFGDLVPRTLYNSSQCRNVFLGASWSHVDPISKINQNYCTL